VRHHRVVGHAGARARVLMDGDGGHNVGVKPQNLVVVVGLLDVLEFLPDLVKVGRCRLTASKSELKPRLITGLATKM